MKQIKYIIFAVVAFGLFSCGDAFLKEEKLNQLTVEYFDTPEGIKSMAMGLPQALRIQGTYEFSYAMNNYGTDEFAVGSDAAGEPWNNYDARLQSRVTSSSNTVHPVATWDPLYISLNSQNMVIKKAPTLLAGDPQLNEILGAAHFMRGWTYFYLVQQWGGVPVVLEPVVGIERNYTRASRKEVVDLVVSEFQQAYDLLTNTATIVEGKIYKDAAAHYLAKALLYRQSEINSEFNAATKDADLAKALTLCDEVIAHRPLAANYADLQNYTGANCASEKLPENILAAQYTTAASKANGRFNKQMCLHYISVYQNWTGMERDIAGGREYARLRTTNYSMDIFDRVNDSRFWKSFRTMQRLNYPSDRNGVFADKTDTLTTSPYRIKLDMGQIGVMFIINNEDDAERFQALTGYDVKITYKPGSKLELSRDTTHKESYITYPGSVAGRQAPPVKIRNTAGVWDTLRCPVYASENYPGKGTNVVPNVIVRYRTVDRLPNAPKYGYAIGSSNSTWPTLNKFLDGGRADYSSDNSERDYVCARVAETYLIAAECKVRQGKYQEALAYINPLRERAAYKSGEDRDKYVDGAQIYKNTTDKQRSTSFWGHNTYYISNNMPVTTAATDIKINSYSSLPAEDMAVINKLGYTSDYDKMLCLVLNERTRELCGEMHRWTDLARTKTLIKRTMAYNEDCEISKTLDEHHYVRPLPQEFLDGTYKDGRPLTADEKQAMQNPGYN